jgi:hypothetical protein
MKSAKMEDDDLAHQVAVTVDDIRKRVWPNENDQPHWRERLVNAAGLSAQEAHLEKVRADFQQAAKEPPTFAGGRCPGFHRVGRGDGRWERIEVWEDESKYQSRWAAIFESAVHDIDFWRAELRFQRMWMDGTLWASRNSYTQLARELRQAYRLFYGAEPILDHTDLSLTPSGQTVGAVADEFRAKAWGGPTAEPECLDWGHAQDAECRLDNIKDRQHRIWYALEVCDLLEHPFVNEIRRRLEPAYQAVSFKRNFYESDALWSCRIFDALKAYNVGLAAELMRYYGCFYGTVYAFRGHRIDQPSRGSGHVPDDPTEEQAKACLLDANPLLAELIMYEEERQAAAAAAMSASPHSDPFAGLRARIQAIIGQPAERQE